MIPGYPESSQKSHTVTFLTIFLKYAMYYIKRGKVAQLLYDPITPFPSFPEAELWDRPEF